MLDAQRTQVAEVDPGARVVRTEILDSWRRSKLCGVDPDHVETVENEARLDSRIARVAIPVLESTADVLIGANTSLLLSAPDGTLLWRWDGDGRLKKRLDRSNVHRGAVMTEDVVGTNGLGTALETARSVIVDGPEHFSEAFHDFTCAGAPVRNPVTNRVTGVLSLTTLVGDASPLMGPTLQRVARDIEEELYGESTMHERQMFRHFLAERRRVRSAVVAVSADVLIANAIASALDLDHSALWQRISDSPSDVVGLELAADARVTICRPVERAGHLVGAIVVAESSDVAATIGEREASRRTSSAVHPAAAERSWRRIVADLAAAASTTDRLVVRGPDGVGKRTALRGIVTESGRGYRELECAAVDEVGPDRWLAEARTTLQLVGELVVLAHLDALDQRVARSLASVLESFDRSPDGLRVAATVSDSAASRDALPRALLEQFSPDPFDIPPLRKRPDDVLARLVDQDARLPTLSREAIQLVQRHPWPGNHRQLEQFRIWMLGQNRAILGADDLPTAWRDEISSHGLTSIQAAESEIIADALRQASGNKTVAATELGISRSSLYRKMREYRLSS